MSVPFIESEGKYSSAVIVRAYKGWTAEQVRDAIDIIWLDETDSDFDDMESSISEAVVYLEDTELFVYSWTGEAESLITYFQKVTEGENYDDGIISLIDVSSTEAIVISAITSSPTLSPTMSPTAAPTVPAPTVSPSAAPSVAPTMSPTLPVPTASPSAAPTLSPTTPAPTSSPTLSPTASPTTALGWVSILSSYAVYPSYSTLDTSLYIEFTETVYESAEIQIVVNLRDDLTAGNIYNVPGSLDTEQVGDILTMTFTLSADSRNYVQPYILLSSSSSSSVNGLFEEVDVFLWS